MENYEVLGDIGRGSFGIVQKVKRLKDGKILVWKELDYGKMSEKEKQQLVSEVNILRDLKHPNIVRYYDRIIDKPRAKIFIVMEYCEGGDMGQMLKKCRREKDYINEEVVWKIFMQIVLALYECHHRKEGKILHRDLKPGNVFFDSKNNVKLGDFGLARVLSKESQYACTHVGTPYYMSPEQIKESKYNEKSDIWSAGCVLYEMAALRPPFEAQNQLSLATKIRAGKFDKLPPKYSDELNRVICWMLRVNAEERPTVDDLLNVPQISLRLREKRLRENQCLLQKKQDEICKKEIEVIEKEKNVEILKKIIEEKTKLIESTEKRVAELRRKTETKSVNVTVLTENINALNRADTMGEHSAKNAREITAFEDKIRALATMDNIRADIKRPGTAFSGLKLKENLKEPCLTRIGISAKKKFYEGLNWVKKN